MEQVNKLLDEILHNENMVVLYSGSFDAIAEAASWLRVKAAGRCTVCVEVYEPPSRMSTHPQLDVAKQINDLQLSARIDKVCVVLCAPGLRCREMETLPDFVFEVAPLQPIGCVIRAHKSRSDILEVDETITILRGHK